MCDRARPDCIWEYEIEEKDAFDDYDGLQAYLNARGRDGWEAFQIERGPDSKGNLKVGICFRRLIRVPDD